MEQKRKGERGFAFRCSLGSLHEVWRSGMRRVNRRLSTHGCELERVPEHPRQISVARSTPRHGPRWTQCPAIVAGLLQVHSTMCRFVELDTGTLVRAAAAPRRRTTLGKCTSLMASPWVWGECGAPKAGRLSTTESSDAQNGSAFA